jgi:hypothetical protein
LNVHGVSDFGQAEVHAVESVLHEYSALEFGMAAEKLEIYKFHVFVK